MPKPREICFILGCLALAAGGVGVLAGLTPTLLWLCAGAALVLLLQSVTPGWAQAPLALAGLLAFWQLGAPIWWAAAAVSPGVAVLLLALAVRLGEALLAAAAWLDERLVRRRRPAAGKGAPRAGRFPLWARAVLLVAGAFAALAAALVLAPVLSAKTGELVAAPSRP